MKIKNLNNKIRKIITCVTDFFFGLFDDYINEFIIDNEIIEDVFDVHLLGHDRLLEGKWDITVSGNRKGYICFFTDTFITETDNMQARYNYLQVSPSYYRFKSNNDTGYFRITEIYDRNTLEIYNLPGIYNECLLTKNETED